MARLRRTVNVLNPMLISWQSVKGSVMRVLLILLLAASPVAADEIFNFQSPSGNIHCAIMTGDDYSAARCDLMEFTQLNYPDAPADCDLDWGHAYEVGLSGEGTPICAGDTVADPESAVLPYGQSLFKGDFVCSSEDTGITCTNPEGHGFTVAKRSQHMF
jgi:hypothetical protein